MCVEFGSQVGTEKTTLWSRVFVFQGEESGYLFVLPENLDTRTPTSGRGLKESGK